MGCWQEDHWKHGGRPAVEAPPPVPCSASSPYCFRNGYEWQFGVSDLACGFPRARAAKNHPQNAQVLRLPPRLSGTMYGGLGFGAGFRRLPMHLWSLSVSNDFTCNQCQAHNQIGMISVLESRSWSEDNQTCQQRSYLMAIPRFVPWTVCHQITSPQPELHKAYVDGEGNRVYSLIGTDHCQQRTIRVNLLPT